MQSLELINKMFYKKRIKPNEQLADVFTKALSNTKFVEFRTHLNMFLEREESRC